MKFPDEPRAGESIKHTVTQLMRWCRATRITGIAGGQVREGPNGTVLIPGNAKAPAAQQAKKGRFQLSFSGADQRLLIAEGAVAFDEDKLVTPKFPTLNNNSIAGGSYWDLTVPSDAGEWTSGTDYRIVVIVTQEDEDSRLEVLGEEDPEDEEGDEDWTSQLVIGTVRFKPSDSDPSKLALEELVQLWQSDILWPYPGSSSSAPSSGDSGDSSGDSEGSEKSSNAIVPLATRETRFAALATMESNQVLFEFVLRDIEIAGRETRVRIHPDHLAVCEPETLTVCGSPCAPTPHPVGAEVVGEDIVIRASAMPWRRPRRVTLKLTGVRRGFGGWDMPNRTEAQFTENENSLKAMYKR
jgi:hypothetical protein